MNKCITLISLLLLSSCSLISGKKNNSTTVIANFSTNILSQSSIKLKLKTDLYRDSAVVQINPLVGFSFATLLVKDNNIYVTNNLTNDKVTFPINDFDPELDVKKLIRLVIKKKNFNDTMHYQNPNVDYMFYNYDNVEIKNTKNKILSLPRQISIKPVHQFNNHNHVDIMIDYKLIKLNK